MVPGCGLGEWPLRALCLGTGSGRGSHVCFRHYGDDGRRGMRVYSLPRRRCDVDMIGRL